MPIALDPFNLTPAASLNRVRLLATPPGALPPEVVGMRAYDLLAARKLAALIREDAAVLGLLSDRDSDDDILIRRFDPCFVAQEDDVRAAAERIARRAGLALGCARADAPAWRSGGPRRPARVGRELLGVVGGDHQNHRWRRPGQRQAWRAPCRPCRAPHHRSRDDRLHARTRRVAGGVAAGRRGAQFATARRHRDRLRLRL